MDPEPGQPADRVLLRPLPGLNTAEDEGVDGEEDNQDEEQDAEIQIWHIDPRTGEPLESNESGAVALEVSNMEDDDEGMTFASLSGVQPPINPSPRTDHHNSSRRRRHFR